jgi:hypothetical protein
VSAEVLGHLTMKLGNDVRTNQCSMRLAAFDGRLDGCFDFGYEAAEQHITLSAETVREPH